MAALVWNCGSKTFVSRRGRCSDRVRTRSFRCLTQTREDRSILSLWIIDAYRIAAALGLIVVTQLATQPANLHADERIYCGIVRRRLVIDFQRDQILFERLTLTVQ